MGGIERGRRRRVLVVEDDDGARAGVRAYLEARGFVVDEAEDAGSAEAAFTRTTPEAVLLDERLPDRSGMDVLEWLRRASADTPVIMMTGHGSIELAVRALKLGAEQFLTKPVDMQAVALSLERLLEGRRDRRRRIAGEHRAPDPDPFLGNSGRIRELREKAHRVLGIGRPILIQGETGTGKGVLARWLHGNGPRSSEAFVDINCASLSRELLESELFGHETGAFTGAVKRQSGLMEAANHGTLFLDEIGDMDAAVQPRLLKVIEERRYRRLGDVRDLSVDVQLLAATHQDVEAAMRAGRFREDLYFRISAMPLWVPPLRERGDDVVILARVLLERFASEIGRNPVGLKPDALGALVSYGWPGNIRELRNVLERAVLICSGSELTAADLQLTRTPQRGSSHPSLAAASPAADERGHFPTLREMEKRHIVQGLRLAGGKVQAAAEILGISTSSLYERIRRFEIEAAPEKGGASGSCVETA